MSYRVELAVFSGPMDLLLHLVKQQEVDIHEIRIAEVMEQYLEHLDVLKALDLVDLGDFIVMASTLMEIKSRDLLPREEVELEEGLDPRDDLIRRLLEYKRYRDISRRLDRMMHRRSRMISPEAVSAVREPEPESQEQQLDIGDFSIWNLTEAFAKLLEETGTDQTMRFDVTRKTVRFYADRMLDQLKRKPRVRFSELFDRAEGRVGLIGSFTALLEMMKQGYVLAEQELCSGPIEVVYEGPQDLTVEAILGREAFATEIEESAAENAAADSAQTEDAAVAGEASDAAGEAGGAS